MSENARLALVTGATGYIGGQVAQELLRRGWRVRLLSRSAEKVRNLPAGEGLNAANGDYGDMLAFGIADPVKVTRSALQNAASIAALFLTTEAVIADKPEKTPAMPAGGDGGMGGMDF